MPGLTDRDLQRIERFVRTSPIHRTPDILLPTDGTDAAAPERADGARTTEDDRAGPDDSPSAGR